MDAATTVTSATLDARTRLADVVWNAVPITRLNWDDVAILGDEQIARQRTIADGRPKGHYPRLSEYRDAVLANRQVATLLRSQGLNEPADRFAYRAQVLQRRVLRLQGMWQQAFGSWILDRVAGHGYKPGRTLVAYLVSILGFAALLLLAGNGLLTFGLPPSQYHTLPWYEALILSVSSFHGRGFFQPLGSPGDPVAILAALEAVCGLFIEISFIATFTQRFFNSR
jgi:hypothetical protein